MSLSLSLVYVHTYNLHVQMHMKYSTHAYMGLGFLSCSRTSILTPRSQKPVSFSRCAKWISTSAGSTTRVKILQIWKRGLRIPMP